MPIYLLLISAFSAKRTRRNNGWWQGALIRIAICIVVLSIVHFWQVPIIGRGAMDLGSNRVWSSNDFILSLDVVLCAVGVSFAIWARANLGRNWGMPTALKENPELVTDGPYAYVRHPIYTGILLAVVGSMLGSSVFWIIPIAIGAYFIYSAVAEEKILTKEFLIAYPEYKKRTKMLLLFIF